MGWLVSRCDEVEKTEGSSIGIVRKLNSDGSGENNVKGYLVGPKSGAPEPVASTGVASRCSAS